MILTALFTLAIATPSANDGILAFADAFDRAQLTQDAARLNEMVADELVFIDGSGKRQGKKDFIAGWTAQGDRFDPVVLIDRKVIPLGSDAAIVNAETTLAGISGGQRFASRIRFADTFRRVGGKWRAVHIQVTPIR